MIFDDALPHILKFEGGYADHPDDPGGSTNFGITQATYDLYRLRIGTATQSVRHITQDEVRTIYHDHYWVPAKCEQLPSHLRLAHFDCAVNCGIITAAKILQRAIGVKDDGIIGPITLTATRGANRDDLLFERLRHYATIASAKRSDGRDLKIFLPGWINRTLQLRSLR